MTTEQTRAIRVRDKRKPGHCWQDNELYDVFQPVIGATATHIFAAMTRWAFGHRVEMGVREIAVESGTSRSAVQRAVVVMERLGMMRRVSGRGSQPAAYDLLDLKEAAVALGAVWDPHRCSHVLPSSRAAVIRTELVCVPYGDANARDVDGVCVPYGDAGGTLVSQKAGVCVPQGDAHPFVLQDTKLQDHHPLPLPLAEGEGVDSLVDDLAREAGRVWRACGFTAKSILRAIERQLRQVQAHGPQAALAVTADRMIAHWSSYCADQDLMRFAWGPRKFFDGGHWARPNTWPIDHDRLAAMRAARVGAR